MRAVYGLTLILVGLFGLTVCVLVWHAKHPMVWVAQATGEDTSEWRVLWVRPPDPRYPHHLWREVATLRSPGACERSALAFKASAPSRTYFETTCRRVGDNPNLDGQRR